MKPKIYTRTGDGGHSTHPSGSGRVSKSHPHLELAGLFDELGAFLGLARASLNQTRAVTETDKEVAARIEHTLKQLQRALLLHFPALFTSEGQSDGENPAEANTDTINTIVELTISLEKEIDSLEAPLPELTHFILSGGSLPGASLHVARAVCRRTERHLVTQHQEMEKEVAFAAISSLINRLSDYLFTAARVIDHACGQEETTV